MAKSGQNWFRWLPWQQKLRLKFEQYFFLFLSGNDHYVKVSSNSEMVRGMALWKFFGALRELMLKVKPVYQQMTLSPKLGVVEISTLWHFRLPLPILMFIKVVSSPRLSEIGMPSPILWSHPLKMQRIVLLTSLLWWELGTNSLTTGPGEWLSFRRFTSTLSWSWLLHLYASALFYITRYSMLPI